MKDVRPGNENLKQYQSKSIHSVSPKLVGSSSVKGSFWQRVLALLKRIGVNSDRLSP
jgi:hypothetical protein